MKDAKKPQLNATDRAALEEFKELYEDGIIDARHWLHAQVTAGKMTKEAFAACLDEIFYAGKRQA